MQLAAEGKRQPILDQMPILDFWELRYWNAFSYLSSRRQSGMGLSPILYQDIISYLNENLISSQDMREDYANFIVLIDNYFLKKKSDEHSSKGSIGSSSAKPKSPPKAKK